MKSNPADPPRRNRRQLPLDALRTFEVAARHSSFVQAALESGVTPSAVSHQIRRLEEHIGVQLFERHRQRVRLTDKGEFLSRRLLTAFDQMEEAIRELSPADDRSLVISVTSAFATKWLASRLPVFASTRADLRIKLRADDNFADFNSDGVDIGIRFGRGGYPGLHSTLLFAVDYVPVCSPSLTPRGRSSFSHEDLRSMRLLHDESASRALDLPTWKTWLESVGMRDVGNGGGLVFETPQLAIEAAISGHGAALGIWPLVADDVASGRLVRMFEEGVRGPFSFWMVYPTAKRNSKKLLSFEKWITKGAMQTDVLS